MYELVFGERLGVDLCNGLAWDRSGKTISLNPQGGNDTQFALEGFFKHVRRGERSHADAEVGYRATVASLLSLKALDTEQVALWDELIT